jgi:hypothetical protein
MDDLTPKTLDDAKVMAARIAKWAKERGHPTAMEVVLDSKKRLNVQPFGMHAMFKTHKLLHVEPIPN